MVETQETLQACACALRAIALCARGNDPEIAAVACDSLDSLGLTPEQRMAAADPCPIHGYDINNLAFFLSAAGIFEEVRVRRGERPMYELIAERITAQALPHQMQQAGRA